MRYSEQVLFCVSTGLLYYLAGTNEYDNVKNRYYGLFGALGFLIVVGMLRPYDGPFKTNQWLWRACFQLTVIYNAVLVYLAFQNEKEARYKQLMSLGDKRLGIPVTKEMHTYDDHCEFHWINFWDNIDHYYLTHCVNWFMVALLLRDAWILNFWSVYDEILELTWQHILPHFRECWWDHVLLDVLLSNTVFLFVGLWVSKKLGIEQYDWLGRADKSFFQWEFWTNYHHFGGVMGILVIITFNFLDGFFLMNSLWMPPVCWMPISRLFIWFLIGNQAFREHWSQFQGKAVSGQMRFLCVWTMMIETFIAVKFLKDCGNIQDVPTPYYITIPWVVVITVCGLYYLYLRIFRSDAKPYTKINEMAQTNNKHKRS